MVAEKMTNVGRYLILSASALCLAMIYIDQTAVAVALPGLHLAMHLTEVQQQWVVNSYLLSWAALILLAGKLVDIYGNKRIFMLGILGFLCSSILCGIATNAYFLIIMRFIQGAFGSVLSPSAAIAIINTFPDNKRGSAMGMYSGSASIFMALGPLLGGFFTQFMSWRWVFFINVPFCLLALVFLLLNLEDNSTNEKVAIDWLSILAIGIATSSLIIAIMEGVSFGWGSVLILGLFALFFVAMCLFIFIESKAKEPLLDFNIFTQPNYLVCCFLGFCVRLCSMVRIFLAVFFQVVFGYAAFLAGILILPAVAPTMVVAPLSGKLLDRFGAKVPIVIGFVLLFLGLILIAAFTANMSYWWLLPGVLLLGLGLPMIGSASYTVALSNVAKNKRGMAAGGYNQCRYFGGTFGMAVIGAIITNISSYFFNSYLIKANMGMQLHQINVTNVLINADSAQHALYHFAQLAYSQAFQDGVMFSAVFAFLALLLAVLKLKNNN